MFRKLFCLVGLLVAAMIPVAAASASNAISNRSGAFPLPVEQMVVSHSQGKVSVKNGAQDFIVSTTEEDIVTTSYNAIFQDGVDTLNVYGEVILFPDGMQNLIYAVAINNSVVSAGVIGGMSMLNGGVVIVWTQNCECSDHVTFGCSPTECANGDKCSQALSGQPKCYLTTPAPGPNPAPAPKPSPTPPAPTPKL